MKSGIYCIKNILNNKKYVGQSINIKERWTNHKWYATQENIKKSNKRGFDSILHIAMRKYGIENFKLIILEECKIESLDKREIFWINKLGTISPNGYNISTGGQLNKIKNQNKCIDCGCIIERSSIRCHKCEVKRRTNNWLTDNDYNTICSMLKSGKTFEQISIFFGCKRKILCDQLKRSNKPHTKRKILMSIGISYKKEKSKRKSIIKNKPINKYDLHGNLIAEYISIKSAAKENNIHENLIRKVLYKKLKKTHGYVYRFKSD